MEDIAMNVSNLLAAVCLTFTIQTAFAQQNPTATPQEKAEKADENSPASGAIKTDDKPIPLNDNAADSKTEAAPATSTPSEKPAAKTEDKGSWYFGPNAAFGIPHFTTYGFDVVMPNGFLSFGFNTGNFEGKSGDVKIGLKTQDLAVRLHPFSGSFYLGAAFGNQTLYAQQSQTISTIPVTLKVNIKSSYMIPHIGWMWGIKDGGFFFSTELGMQSPSGVKTDLETDADAAIKATADYQDLEKEVTDMGDKIGKIGLPFLTLVKMGWLF